MVAGTIHTVVATDAGEVLTFGCGYDGCLGHGGTRNELLPRAVDLEWEGEDAVDDNDAEDDDEEEEEDDDDNDAEDDDEEEEEEDDDDDY